METGNDLEFKKDPNWYGIESLGKLKAHYTGLKDINGVKIFEGDTIIEQLQNLKSK